MDLCKRSVIVCIEQQRRDDRRAMPTPIAQPGYAALNGPAGNGDVGARVRGRVRLPCTRYLVITMTPRGSVCSPSLPHRYVPTAPRATATSLHRLARLSSMAHRGLHYDTPHSCLPSMPHRGAFIAPLSPFAVYAAQRGLHHGTPLSPFAARRQPVHWRVLRFEAAL